MKIIIAGGRKYILTTADKVWLDTLRTEIPITEVVSGEAQGADAGGEAWALINDIPVKGFPADWDRTKPGWKGAGVRRNEEMAKYANGLAVFPGNRGTADMIARASMHGLPIWFSPSVVNTNPDV